MQSSFNVIATPADVFRLFTCYAVVLLGMVILAAAPAAADTVKSDERIVFFPTAGAFDEQRETWSVPIHGWIFEPERDSKWRRATIAAFAEYFDLKADTPTAKRLAERAAMFLVDNERGKAITVRIAGRTVELDDSEANGHFRGVITLAADAVREHAVDDQLTIAAVLDDDDPRRFAGRALLVPPTGVSVISDIDDTIKVSRVTDRKALLEHTFVKPFEAAPGMARAYARWAKQGVAFHYVSSSPWQLAPALGEFMRRDGFPPGDFHLKHFRLKDKSLLSLFADPTETKPPIITAILKRYPRRRFVLIGDSGERDPEVYGRIARQSPDQVLHIYIRRAPGGDHRDQRFNEAFKDVAKEKWTLFEDGKELAQTLKVE